MIYQHKKTKALVETICSGPGWTCFVELGADKQYDSSSGKVFRGCKRDFKKIFEKASDKTIKKANVHELPEQLKEQVAFQIERDIYFILHDLDDYILRRGDLADKPPEEASK